MVSWKTGSRSSESNQVTRLAGIEGGILEQSTAIDQIGTHGVDGLALSGVAKRLAIERIDVNDREIAGHELFQGVRELSIVEEIAA